MQVGLLGEALHLPTEEGSARVPWISLDPSREADRDSDTERAESKLDGADNSTRPPQGQRSVGSTGALTWLKAHFDAPSDWSSPEALAVDLTGATKGHVYVNGFDAGRYWVRNPVISTYYQLPPDNLKPTGNLLVLWEEIGVEDISKIRVVRRVQKQP